MILFYLVLAACLFVMFRQWPAHDEKNRQIQRLEVWCKNKHIAFANLKSRYDRATVDDAEEQARLENELRISKAATEAALSSMDKADLRAKNFETDLMDKAAELKKVRALLTATQEESRCGHQRERNLNGLIDTMRDALMEYESEAAKPKRTKRKKALDAKRKRVRR